jgi:glycosyltransferase involved in cell wall biosynthesis
MRVLVDYRPALRARTGVGEYIHGLVRAYTAAHGDRVTLFTSSWKDRPAPGLAGELGVDVLDRRVPVRVLNYLWHGMEWPPVERLGADVDVVHAAHPLLIPARRAAQVITIHDLYFLDAPEQARAEIRRDYPVKAPSHAARAHAIVTSSHHTRRLVVERLGVPADRVYVCRPGAPVWHTLGREPNVPPGGYVLFLGTLEPRKNVGTLLDAYAHLVARLPSAPRLVLAGRATAASREWLDRLNHEPLKGRVEHRGYVPAGEKERLYAGARALVLPSWDEGFNMVALEAMSAGVPVVVSTRGSLPETVGDGGALVDAADAGGLAAALERLVTDEGWAAGQARAGLARARTFTWDAAAAMLRQAYTDAAARRRAVERRVG